MAWLNMIVDAVCGHVPGKRSRLDPATRMVLEADFSWQPSENVQDPYSPPVEASPIDELMRIIDRPSSLTYERRSAE